MGWWIFLGVLLVLALIPLGIRVSYDSAGFAAKILAGPVKITLFPRKNKKTAHFAESDIASQV